jgi:transcriptional regulator with XRE-family HTH domain
MTLERVTAAYARQHVFGWPKPYWSLAGPLLSGLERGKRNPSVITLYEIAQALGVSHVELVTPDKESGDRIVPS